MGITRLKGIPSYEAEERIRTLFEHSRDALMTTSLPSLRFTSANGSALRMFGAKTESEFYSLTPGEISPDFQPDGTPSEEKARQMVEIAMRAGSHFFEWEHKRLDGSTFPSEVMLTRIEVDRQTFILGSVRDITMRKRGIEQLLLNTRLLEEAQRLAQIGSWGLDLTNDRLDWSDEIFRIFEIDQAKFGATYAAFLNAIHPDDREMVNKAYNNALANHTPYEIAHRLLMADGRIKWVNERGETFYDDHGKPVRSIGTVQDITERKHSEEAVARISGEFEDLYEHAPCGYHSLDSNGVFVRINDTELEWLGYARDEVVGKMKWQDVVTPESFKTFHKNFSLFKKQGFVRDLEYEMVRKDGTTFVGQTNASAIYDSSGNYLMSRGTVLNISKRKSLERELREKRNEMELLQKHQVAAQTAAAFAHDLNQPLSAISSYADTSLMLLDAEKPNLDKARRAIRECGKQALRAGNAIRQLLDFLHMGEVPTEAFDLAEDIRNIVDITRSELELQFDVEFRMTENLLLVQANRIHVQKILLNLLHNSIDAMQEARMPLPKITITVRPAEDEGVAQITIQDSGPGIKQEDLMCLFQPFFTTKKSGFGMGLGISRSLIEANGGQLWVDPEEGLGATFHLTLPFAS